MESNFELKKINIKNRACYYFDDIIKIEDFDFYILLDKKLYENILIYDHFIHNFDWCKTIAYKI